MSFLIATAPVSTVAEQLNASIANLGRDIAVYQREQRKYRFGPVATTSDVKNSELFSDPSATVVMETCDHMVYRVHDFFLKANSGFFRDMLSDSNPSTSTEKPLPLSESSEDWDIVLLIITGGAQAVGAQSHKSWNQAARLYQISQKYQLDSHRHWFTEICVFWLHEQPLEALILACDRPEIDEQLAQHAIVSLWKADPNALYNANPHLFRTAMPITSPVVPYATTGDFKRSLLDPTNITLKFGVALGYKGSLAYNFAFAGLASGSCGRLDTFDEWQCLSLRFLSAVRVIEHEIIVARIVSSGKYAVGRWDNWVPS